MNTSNFEEIYRLFQELAQTLVGKNGQRKFNFKEKKTNALCAQ